MWSDWVWFLTLTFFLNKFIPWNRCLAAIWELYSGFTVCSYGYGWFLIPILVGFFNFTFYRFFFCWRQAVRVIYPFFRLWFLQPICLTWHDLHRLDLWFLIRFRLRHFNILTGRQLHIIWNCNAEVAIVAYLALCCLPAWEFHYYLCSCHTCSGDLLALRMWSDWVWFCTRCTFDRHSHVNLIYRTIIICDCHWYCHCFFIFSVQLACYWRIVDYPCRCIYCDMVIGFIQCILHTSI